MVFYFVLMACYSSLKNSYKRLTPEHQHTAAGFDWKVAGFGVSLLMLPFIIGATRFCLLLPSIFVFISVIAFCGEYLRLVFETFISFLSKSSLLIFYFSINFLVISVINLLMTFIWWLGIVNVRKILYIENENQTYENSFIEDRKCFE